MRTTSTITIALCLAVMAGSAHAQSPARPPARPASAAAKKQAPPKTPKATAAKATPAAEAGEWKTDAEGRQYRVEPLPRTAAQKISPTQVRTMFGITADLDHEDDASFYIRIYKVDPPAPVAAPIAPVTDPAVAPPERMRFRFVPYGTDLPSSGQWRENLALADLDADGRLDIVAPPPRKSLGAPVAYLNGGDGSWRRWTAVEWPKRPYDYGAVAAGDLDADGDSDLVLGVHLHGTMALKREGNGFVDASGGLDFAARADEVTFSSRALTLVDCNGDRRLDIAALSEGPRLSRAPGQGGVSGGLGLTTYVQNGDGTWVAKPPTAGDRAFGNAVVAADVDGDGRPDLVTASSVLGRQDLVRRGGPDCAWTAETVDEVRPRSYVTAVAAADVDRDGRAEIALGYVEFLGEAPMSGIDVLERDAAGAWQRRAIVREADRNRTESIAIADLDGDGGPEIAAIGENGQTRVFSVNPRGGVSVERQVIASPGGCAGASVVFGDLDGDGTPDLVIAYADEGTATCTGNGGLAAFKTQRAR